MSQCEEGIGSNFVASRLTRLRDKIIGLWEKQIRDQLPEFREKESTDLQDHLPEFLDRLANALHSRTSSKKSEREIPHRHAQQRTSMEEYDVERILIEFVTLRQTILQVLRAEGPLSESETDQIVDCIEKGMAASVSMFADLQLKKIERGVSRLHLALEASGIGLWEVNVPLNKFWKSEILDRLYGRANATNPWSKDFMLSLVDPRDRPSVEKSNQDAISGKEVFEREFRVTWPDGSLHWLSEKGRVVRGADKKLIWMMGAVWDITDRKRYEEERTHLLALLNLDLESLRLEREVREKFVLSLSHDLRNPLTAVKTASDLLSKTLGNDISGKYLITGISRSIDRIDKMIRDLLDANVLRAGHNLPIQPRPCDLRAVILEAMQDLTLIYGGRFVLDAEHSILGFWDCDELRRVVENLASNAVKYGFSNTPIRIALSQSGGTTRISVHNNGPEIEKLERAHLFDLFKRGNSVGGRKKGWGIGLALVRGIIEAHQGSIHCESKKGVGTTFVVEIPTQLGTSEQAG